jgi:hypothetical protein
LGVVAVASSFGALALPGPLTDLDRRLPGLFRTHMLSGGIGLALMPLAFLTRRVGISRHKLVGRAALSILLVASAAGLASAMASVAPPWARAGFFSQGLAGAGLLIAAWRAVRHGRSAAHARLMQSAAAVISGVVVLRLGTWAAAALDLDFDTSYAALAWGSWLLPLAGVSAWQTYHGAASHLRWPRRQPIC